MQKSNTPSLVDSLLQSPEFEAATDNMKLFKVAALADDLQKKLAAAQEQIKELQAWKDSAMNVMPDFQEIGRLLKIPLGQDVSSKIIPGITAAQEHAERLRRALEPFAREWETWNEPENPRALVWICEAGFVPTEAEFTVEDLRQASAALAATPSGGRFVAEPVLEWEWLPSGTDLRGFLRNKPDTTLFVIGSHAGKSARKLGGAFVPDADESRREYRVIREAKEAAEEYMRRWIAEVTGTKPE